MDLSPPSPRGDRSYAPGTGAALRSQLHPTPLHACPQGFSGLRRGAVAGLSCPPFAPARVGRKATPSAQDRYSHFALWQGGFLWGAWLGLRWGGGGVRRERRPRSGGIGGAAPGAPGYKITASPAERGLDRIVGPKWRKLGAWRRRASLICRAVAGAPAGGAWPRGFPKSNNSSGLARMKLKCPGPKRNSSRKGALGFSETPKLGKLSQVAAQPPWAV